MAAERRIKWGVLFNGDNLSLDRILRYARMAEEAGADSLWSSDLGRDAFTPLAAMGGVVKSVRLGTAVATFARPPMHTETAAMTLAELTGQKFVLGLGTAPRAWNRDWHGLADYKPVMRMREYVQCIRKMWTSSPTHAIDYDGTLVNVRGYRRFIPAPFEIAALKACTVHADRARARALARHAIAFYATLDYFDIVLDPAGFAEQKERIRAAHLRNDFPAMLDAVTEDMIDALVLAGTADEVRAQLAPFVGLIDTVILTCPIFPADPEETRANHEATIAAFAS